MMRAAAMLSVADAFATTQQSGGLEYRRGLRFGGSSIFCADGSAITGAAGCQKKGSVFAIRFV
jgi:hypothetical protein